MHSPRPDDGSVIAWGGSDLSHLIVLVTASSSYEIGRAWGICLAQLQLSFWEDVAQDSHPSWCGMGWSEPFLWY